MDLYKLTFCLVTCNILPLVWKWLADQSWNFILDTFLLDYYFTVMRITAGAWAMALIGSFLISWNNNANNNKKNENKNVDGRRLAHEQLEAPLRILADVGLNTTTHGIASNLEVALFPQVYNNYYSVYLGTYTINCWVGILVMILPTCIRVHT